MDILPIRTRPSCTKQYKLSPILLINRTGQREKNGKRIADAGGVELVLEALERVNIDFESHAFMAPGIVKVFVGNRYLGKCLNAHIGRATKLVVNCMKQHAELSARMAAVSFTAIHAPIGAMLKKKHSSDVCAEWGSHYVLLGAPDLIRKFIRAYRNDPQFGPIIVDLGKEILKIITGSET